MYIYISHLSHLYISILYICIYRHTQLELLLHNIYVYEIVRKNVCCLMQKVGVLKSKNTHTVCLYLQHRVCWQADVCWHRSEGSAWEEVAPTRPFEGRTAEGCYEGAGQHPFPPQPEPGHLHTHARTHKRTHAHTHTKQ